MKPARFPPVIPGAELAEIFSLVSFRILGEMPTEGS